MSRVMTRPADARLVDFPALLLVIPLTIVALAGDVRAEVSRAPLFADSTVLPVKIVAPFGRITRDRKGEPEDHAGTIEIANSAGEPVVLELKVRARGKFRRQREICRFPPLRLNLRKGQTQGTVFAGQDKLKLVTHCRDSHRYTQYLLKEYLAYRILNRLTDASFGVRLLRIRYAEPDRPDRYEDHYGFVIEHKSALAKRLGAEAVTLEKADRSRFDRSHTALVLVFQYLLGNTDFSFTRGPAGEGCCHNAELLLRDDGVYLPVPYDFDYTGFVDPPYAVPPQQLRLRNIRERLYRGPCDTVQVMQAAVGRFAEAREDIYDLIRERIELDDRIREDLIDYVDEFYEVMDDPRRRDEVLFSRCR